VTQEISNINIFFSGGYFENTFQEENSKLEEIN
jgi:hypothetical protein